MKAKEVENQHPLSRARQLEAALEDLGIEIDRYVAHKGRPLFIDAKATSIEKFRNTLLTKLGSNAISYPGVFTALHDVNETKIMIEEYTEVVGLSSKTNTLSVPDDLKDYTLNQDTFPKIPGEEFFLTTPEEYRSEVVSGRNYIRRCGMSDAEAYQIARPVITKYRPRSPHGISAEHVKGTNEVANILNSYIPPEWAIWRMRNPEAWDKLPDKAPKLVLNLLKHLLPNQIERHYLIAWLYASITHRAYVYPVLCGAPGVGKNRLRLIAKALHGNMNFAAGKKSTLVEKFNTQLEGKTLVWFDELKYTMDMENFMKEIQNDHLAIEGKGVDATSNSSIYVSMMISNNNPRDNYIGFDSRKFAPLVLGNQDLSHSMTSNEIEILSEKIQSDRPGFDVEYVAQIAKWILKWGPKHHEKWKNLEYRGPMFWILAHTSMTRWQKKAIELLSSNTARTRIGWSDTEKAFQWSKVQETYERRTGKNHLQFPDHTSIQNFLEVYRNSEGLPVYQTWKVTGETTLNDFWIKVLNQPSPSNKPGRSEFWRDTEEMKAKEAFDAKKEKHEL